MKLAYSNIGFSAEDDDTVYALLNQNGFTGLEIAPSRFVGETPYNKNNQSSEKAKNLLQKYSLEIPSMQSIWFTRTENIFGGETEFDALKEYTFKAIDFAKETGCKSLVFGCPRNRNKPENANIEVFEQFITQISDYAIQNSCVIAMEANPPIYNTNVINTTAQAFDLVKKLDVAGLKVNLDFGTIINNNESLQLVADNIGYISHVHISEPFLAPLQTRAEHKTLAEILKQNNYQGFVSVETSCQDIETVTRQINYIKEVFYD